MKMLSVDYPTFHGYIYYTGVAYLPGSEKDTGDHIEDWLSVTADMHFFQLVEHLRISATAYLRGVLTSDPVNRRLTIVAAAFVRDRPVAAIISNFENAEGAFSLGSCEEFRASWVRLRPGSSSIVLVTGNKKAVPEEDRSSLRDEVETAGEDARRIRIALQATNRRAARHPNAKETISEECVVVSTDHVNRGSLEMADQPGLSLRSIRNGADFSFNSILDSLGITIEGRVVGAAFATDRQGEVRPSNCRKEEIDYGQSGYRIDSILDADGVGVSVLGISATGTVLGAHAVPGDPTRHRYWTWSGGEELNYLDLDASYASSGCIDSAGEITIVAGTQQEPTIHRFDASGRNRGTLPIPEGMAGPNISRGHESGAVFGSIEVNKDVSDGGRQKPACWNALGECLVLWNLFEGQSGWVVDVSSSGEALVWASYPWFGVVPIVWEPASGRVDRMPGSIIPVAWSTHREILGFNKTEGREVPALLTHPGDWQNVDLNSGFHPQVANGRGLIGGVVAMDGYETPWIMERSGRAPLLLPTYRYHGAAMRFIGEDGTVVGVVSANEESHVVLWRS